MSLLTDIDFIETVGILLESKGGYTWERSMKLVLCFLLHPYVQFVMMIHDALMLLLLNMTHINSSALAEEHFPFMWKAHIICLLEAVWSVVPFMLLLCSAQWLFHESSFPL